MYGICMTRYKKKKTFLVTLSPEDYADMVKLAKIKATTKVDIIRRALREYFEEELKNEVRPKNR